MKKHTVKNLAPSAAIFAIAACLAFALTGSNVFAAASDSVILDNSAQLAPVISEENSTGFDRASVTPGGIVFSNPADLDPGGTAPNIKLVGASNIDTSGDIIIAVDSLQWKSRTNHDDARFIIGLGDKLGVGVTASGNGGVLYYNGTAYPLDAGPVCENGSVALSIRYISTEKRVVILQTSGNRRDAGGVQAAPAYGAKLADQTFGEPIDSAATATLVIHAETQGNGGFDEGTLTIINNISINSNMMIFDDPANDKDRWEAVSANKAGWDFFNPMDDGGESRFGFTLTNGTPNVALGTKRGFQPDRSVEFSFDNFYYKTGSNPNQQGLRIGLNTPQATNKAMLSIKFTQSGISSALFYNNTEYALANRPVAGDQSNGKMAIKVSYSDGGRVKITQYAGTYLPEGSSDPTPVPAGGVVLYDAMPTGIPLTFPVGTHFRMTTGVNNNGGFVADPPATIDNLRLVGRAGGSMSWPDEVQRGVNVGSWLNSGDLAVLRTWGTKIVRAQLVGSAFTPIEESGEWTFPASGWTNLDNFLAAAKANGLKVIIDFHNRTDIFSNTAYNTWSQEDGAPGVANKNKLVSLWRSIATKYKDERSVIAGYEILNEPNPDASQTKPNGAEPLDGADAWNTIVDEVVAAIRAIDRYHSIIIEPVGYANQAYLPRLKYFDPAATQGIIYSIHFYSPHEFTEQGSTIEPKWTFGFDNISGYYYPGVFNRLTNYSPVEYTPMLLDKNYLTERLAPVVSFQSAHPGARIFVGEFGSKRWAPVNLHGKDSTWTFIRDCFELFHYSGAEEVEYPKWDWAVHAFRLGGLEGYTGLENSNIKEDLVTAPRYADTNKIRLYKHYMDPSNDGVEPPAYVDTLPDAQVPATVPAKPYGLSSIVEGEGKIGLAWISTSRTTDYKLKRSESAGGPFAVVATIPAGTEPTMGYTDEDLEHNTTYYYVIAPVNAHGDGPDSDETHATAVNTPMPPRITGQPESQTVADGTQVMLSVSVSGAGAVTFQWYKDGAPIEGATSNTYTIEATPVSAGDYMVKITNANGATDSDIVSIAVTPSNESVFLRPTALTVDACGDVFIVDAALHAVQTITATKGAYVYAGAAGIGGFADDSGTMAKFQKPSGIAVYSGTLYIADSGNHAVRAVNDNMTARTIVSGSAIGLSNPTGIAADSNGNIYLADTDNNVIRKIAVGTNQVAIIAGDLGKAGTADGSGTQALFNKPAGVAFKTSGSAASGNFLYVADMGNNMIRRIALDDGAAVVTTLAGNPGLAGSLDGTGTFALFNQPEGIIVDGAGLIYIADTGNSTIREVTPAGIVTTIAGNPGIDGLSGIAGFKDGTGTNARFNNPKGIALSHDGQYLYIADTQNQTIRQIDSNNEVTTPVYTTGTAPLPKVDTSYEVTQRNKTGHGGGAPSFWHLIMLGALAATHMMRFGKKSNK